MRADSRRTIHMGVNFVFSPLPVLSKETTIRFQQALGDQGIDFETVSSREGKLTVGRRSPTPLEIQVAAIGPSAGQLLILAPQPQRALSLFAQEAEAIVAAFDSTWQPQRRQVLSCDCALRDLYQASGQHAFQELWEMRLGQSAESLASFGRHVLGGGLRFVMPPRPDDPQQLTIEVKVESFLSDTSNFFVETQFTWSMPLPPGEPLDPENRLQLVDAYARKEVVSFIVGGAQ